MWKRTREPERGSHELRFKRKVIEIAGAAFVTGDADDELTPHNRDD